jgi:hypothetical protein
MRLVVALLVSGCIAGAGYSTRDRVTLVAREYTDGVRWGKLEQASAHLPADKRHRFFDRLKAVEDELEIADYELISLDVDKHDKKMNRATARVDYTWALKSRGLIEKTSTEQLWEERDGDWVLAAETRVRGAPLSIFDEPAAPPPGKPAAE